MTRTCLALRHIAFEDLGLIEEVLADHGIACRYLDIGIDDLESVEPAADDYMVVLGGPIGAYEDDLYPYLKDEIAFIRRRLESGKPLVGICLGAQLIAAAAGAAVYPGREKEIGWAPVTLTTAGHASPLEALDGLPVLHWHGDTFDLPEGAVRLASTGPTLNQAFAIGEKVLALQFHIEVLASGVERWLIAYRGEVGAAKGVTIPGLRADTLRFAPEAEAAGRRVINAALAYARLA